MIFIMDIKETIEKLERLNFHSEENAKAFYQIVYNFIDKNFDLYSVNDWKFIGVRNDKLPYLHKNCTSDYAIRTIYSDSTNLILVKLRQMAEQVQT